MPFAVKEMHSTIQGEGYHAGRPAILVRFAGCNFWSGLPRGRGKGRSCAKWCDTDFVGTDGPNGGVYGDEARLVQRAAELWRGTRGRRFCFLTGGEPMLQVTPLLADVFHRFGFKVAIETNGSIAVPADIDWITVSPKAGAPLVQRSGDELKLVYPQDGLDPSEFLGLDFRRFYLQPKDGPDRRAATAAALNYCLAFPRWRLGLQLHKFLGVD